MFFQVVLDVSYTFFIPNTYLYLIRNECPETVKSSTTENVDYKKFVSSKRVT